MPAWVTSAGEVLQEELAAAGCFFCYCLLLLLLQVLLLHEGTHTRCRVPERIASQRHNVVSNEKEKQSLRTTPLTGEAWPIQSVRRKFGQQNAAVESLITSTNYD